MLLRKIMNPEILVVRQSNGYRVLHGHLHLASIMTATNEAIVEASGEGKVKVVKTPDGMLIGVENRRFPLLMDE